MARRTNRSPLFLKDDQLQNLNKISRTRISPAQEIQRARILLSYYEDPNISKVAKKVGVVRDTVYKCIDKALGGCPRISDFQKFPLLISMRNNT